MIASRVRGNQLIMHDFRSILLVDDDPTQVAILNAYFLSLRAEMIDYASDGEKACSIIRSRANQFDLVVTDLNMPNLDGIAFLRRLRDAGYLGKVAIVSGLEPKLLVNAEKIGLGYGLQVIGTVRKPLTKAALDAVFVNPERSVDDVSPARKHAIERDDILAGLERDEFIPFYQPKVDMLTGAVSGAEVLVRWKTDDGITITPDRFILAAEHQGLIAAITYRLFERVAEDVASRPHWNNLHFSLNVSPVMLAEIDLPDRMRDIPRRAGLPAERFNLEVTETGVVDTDPRTVEVLSRLRVNGFELSVDDFGTGASNISNLRQFPYSEVKIDQSFVRNMISDSFCAETVNACITLARELDMRIVAEGIECREIFDLVKSKGIDQGQGFFISRPKNADDIDRLFAHRSAWAGSETADMEPFPAAKTA